MKPSDPVSAGAFLPSVVLYRVFFPLFGSLEAIVEDRGSSPLERRPAFFVVFLPVSFGFLFLFFCLCLTRLCTKHLTGATPLVRVFLLIPFCFLVGLFGSGCFSSVDISSLIVRRVSFRSHPQRHESPILSTLSLGSTSAVRLCPLSPYLCPVCVAKKFFPFFQEKTPDPPFLPGPRDP